MSKKTKATKVYRTTSDSKIYVFEKTPGILSVTLPLENPEKTKIVLHPFEIPRL